jgi:hypothetical protein
MIGSGVRLALAGALTLLALTFAAAPALADDKCVLKTTTATFDLNPLSSSSAPNTAHDRDPVRTEFLYAWAICHGLEPTALPEGEPQELCKDKVGAAAFQIVEKKKEHEAKCMVLGRADSTTLSQITDGSATGVTVKFANGDECGSTKTKASFTVHYICSQFAGGDVVVGTVVEKTTCDYHLTVQSVYGCPSECYSAASAAASDDVCTAHGICSVDPVFGAARCYCNSGFRGAHCDSRTSTPSSATPPMMAVLVILLLALIGAVALLVHRTRKLTSPQHLDYAQMGDDGTLPMPAHDIPARNEGKNGPSSISVDL